MDIPEKFNRPIIRDIRKFKEQAIFPKSVTKNHIKSRTRPEPNSDDSEQTNQKKDRVVNAQKVELNDNNIKGNKEE